MVGFCRLAEHSATVPFLAQSDSGFVASDELQGQYDTSVNLPAGERITFDVEQDAFGNVYATNIQPE